MSLTPYNVLVDFEKTRNITDNEVVEAFPDAIHTEIIGPGQFQVSYSVIAGDKYEAYRLAANLVTAKANAGVIGAIEILDGTVYGPDEAQHSRYLCQS